MKILYLSQSRIPSKSANSIHVMKMCKAFERMGAGVTLLGIKGDKNNIDLGEYYGSKLDFDLVIFPIKEKKGEIIKLALYDFFWFLKNKKQHFDLIYSRSSLCLVLFLMFKKKFIYEIHSSPRTKLHLICEKLIFKNNKLNKIVFISEQLERYYKSKFHNLKNKDICIAADASDPFPLYVDKISLKGKSNFNIGYIGHLYPGKGGETIIDISKRMPDINFHIVGGLEKDIEKLEKQKKNKNLYFYGHVSHKQTKSYLNEFDIVLAPYKNKVNLANTSVDIGQWMSPLKIFEYMASGKPIIASNLKVLREVLFHEKNCLLADPDKISEWVDQINKLKTNKNLRNKISKKAKEDFLEKYTWEKRAEKIIGNLI